MIRSAMGAFGAILGTTGGAASRTSGRLLAGRQFAVRRISTRIPQGPVPWHDRMAAGNMLRQLWMRRPVQKPMRALRVGHPRAPNGQPRRSFHSTKTRRAAEGAKDQGAVGHQSLSARLKKLSKEYGWAAVGIYLGLSVLDFPFCFLLVRTLGTERIGRILTPFLQAACLLTVADGSFFSLTSCGGGVRRFERQQSRPRARQGDVARIPSCRQGCDERGRWQ